LDERFVVLLWRPAELLEGFRVELLKLLHGLLVERPALLCRSLSHVLKPVQAGSGELLHSLLLLRALGFREFRVMRLQAHERLRVGLGDERKGILVAGYGSGECFEQLALALAILAPILGQFVAVGALLCALRALKHAAASSDPSEDVGTSH
jgi:hypothetical protein